MNHSTSEKGEEDASETSSTLDGVKVKEEFSRLSEVLQETNRNLSIFEFLLSNRINVPVDSNYVKSILTTVKESNDNDETNKLNLELENMKSKLRIEKIRYRTETSMIKKSLEIERKSRLGLEKQLTNAHTRHKEYETELGDLRTGLEALKSQLETREETARSLLSKDIDELEASLHAHRLKTQRP
ncbi:uncharacterized protein [Lepeophtheirus salmonis]|uniref:uncharacterized protein n=1 Tax=Lepeophtheirus salmonis TaxID=72036 RepID=UPI001AE971D1|nr:uncharacterized protein LOC121116397 [Lepeophtheirus salmonis]XP_040566585.1 uncharacterized protein LOC121116397 [Lepeophtheirus salmonis]XP_040566586.1 uncharacterized protein LOC121116397 [Lepeophtheirus salmonis]